MNQTMTHRRNQTMTTAPHGLPRPAGPDQPGPGGICNAIQFVASRSRSGQNFAQQRQQPLDVVARGQFGHHPAIDPVQFDLAE